MKRFLFQTIACLGLVGLLGTAPLLAQPMHTLVIRDGTVWIDEQPIPADELPASLDLDGLTLEMNYSGPVQLFLGNAAYRVDATGLREVDNRAGLPGAGAVLHVQSGAAMVATDSEAAREASMIQVMNEYSQELEARSQRLKQLRDEAIEQKRRLDDGQAEDVDQLIERASEQAEEAAKVARELPRLQMQNYYFQMQQQNQALYDLLVREAEMEQEVLTLARSIRTLPEGAERQRRLDVLAARLSDIFELKQENRRREIAQLEDELEALQLRLKVREQHRQRIIEQRMKELVGPLEHN